MSFITNQNVTETDLYRLSKNKQNTTTILLIELNRIIQNYYYKSQKIRWQKESNKKDILA